MEALLPEAEAAGDDPVAGAALVRKLYRSAGLPMNEAMEETLRRLERGEDPETLDEDIGSAFEASGASSTGSGGRTPASLRHRAPARDPELHEL